MNVCMRRLGAAAIASPAFLTSEGFARASEQTVELRITLEIAQMDSKSPERQPQNRPRSHQRREIRAAWRYGVYPAGSCLRPGFVLRHEGLYRK